MKFFKIISLALAVASSGSILCATPKDSVKVIKGQVSDYFIPVDNSYLLKGFVYDQNNKPLSGATVMFRYSPIHFNTSDNGYFQLKASPTDSVLQVYYPGKKILTRVFKKGENGLTIRLTQPYVAQPQPAHTRTATPWFDPQNDSPNTFCNPMNISYNFEFYNNNSRNGGSFRSAADPMILRYKNEYYLFTTNQDGFFWSKDLSRWHFVFSGWQRRPDQDDQCAPAAFVSGDTLYCTGSTYEGLPVWYSTHPKTGRFKRKIERNVLPTWDPGFLLDDDGRLYEYYGSSNEYATKGVEISRDTFYPISKIKNLVQLQPKQHGWERFGMNNDDSTTLAPFMEGSWMNKINGKYYYQYGAPGTEFKVYADGVYVSDNPLGPFTYQKFNPMSYKPGGFVQGAGHSGTFDDNFGNYWHVATCMLSLKYKFERRIGLYPAGVDRDGIMYTNTAWGDYPCYVPTAKEDHVKGNFAGWMLLSYHKAMTASSSDSIYTPQNASDENMRTFWAAKTNQAGEWLAMDLGKSDSIQALQINYYDYKAYQFGRAMDLYHQYKIYYSNDAKQWNLLVDKSDNDTDVPHDYVQLRQPVVARYLKLENVHMAAGNFAVSDFRVFGRAAGQRPETVRKFKVVRSHKDTRNAMLSWNPVPNAYGYQVFYGIAPDKLYGCITVNGADQYDFRGLDLGTTYYFSIQAMSEKGLSERTKPIKVN